MNEKLALFKKMGGVFLLLLAFSLNAMTQVQVRGVVLDELGEPAIGATIQVKGTTQGTVTDMDGVFTVSAPVGGTLVISYVGYATQEIAVSANVRVHLQPDSELLDELVVVGYGVMRRSDVTGSVAQARGADIIRGQSFNALDGLRGRAAGVNILGNTGQPGGEMRVIIRGVSTINASSSPLYVVDGVAMSNLQFLNPNDIESIEVLKDASSAAIYGARGANGVILVTTKRGGGTDGSARISYAGSVSVSGMQSQMQMMDSEMWMATFKEGLENANRWQGMNFDTDVSKIFTDRRFFRPDGTPIYNTNWQDESSRTAVSHNHQLSIQRGSREHQSGAFINYTDQQGILYNTYQKRLSARLVYDDRPVRWLSTTNNIMVNHAWGNRTSDNPYGLGALRVMIEQLPFLPVMYDGEYIQSNNLQTSRIPTGNLDSNGDPTFRSYGPEGMGNPVEILKRVQNMQYRTQIFGNTGLTFHLTDDLTIRTQFGAEYRIDRDERYEPVTPRPIMNHASLGMARGEAWNRFYWQEETFLNYNKRLNRHSINAMAGMSWQGYTFTRFHVQQNGFNDDFYGFYNLSRGTERPTLGSSQDSWTMNSYFGRLAYSLDSKYLATLTTRVDGSSKFGANNKYAFFPSIGLGWIASNEDFLIDNRTISRLKPRTSFGITGNSEISTFRALPGMITENVNIGNSIQGGIRQDRIANPNLRWERTAMWDAGIEIGLFNDRLNFEGSYYYKYTSDLLLDVPLPRSTGYASMMANVGEVSNRGLDLMITAHPVQTRDFSWSSTLNASFNRSRVEKLDESSAVDPTTGKRQILLDGFTGYDMIIREGEQLSSFYGYRRAGIYNGVPADWNSETMNVPGLTGQRVTYKQREIIGNGLPDWMGSFSNTFAYKGFDLTVDLQFTLGVDVMQEFMHSTEGRFLTSGLKYLYENAWHPERNPHGTGQAIRLANFGMGNDSNTDDTWVANGSYLRGNLVQLGYTFQSGALQKMGLSALRLYANASNLFLLTSKNYHGYDPDNSSRLGSFDTGNPNNWGANRQFFTYPRARTFTFGMNVAF
ncbi:MAG: TonB-dependent receptor [Dysgonamonadaceae bacterium]|nr:TonB-dependent receptor [Dysgonamonadaceae bacterium]